MKPSTKAKLSAIGTYIAFCVLDMVLMKTATSNAFFFGKYGTAIIIIFGVIAIGGYLVAKLVHKKVLRKATDYYEAHLPPEEVERRAKESKEKLELWQNFMKRSEEIEAKRAEERKNGIASKTVEERLYDIEEHIETLYRWERDRRDREQQQNTNGSDFGIIVIAAIILGVLMGSHTKEIKKEIESVKDSIERIEYRIR